LFKGQLSYNEMMYGMPYKRLASIKEARVAQLLSESKEMEKLSNTK